MSGLMIKFVFFGVVGVVVSLLGVYVRTVPNRAKKNPQAQRMTKLIVIVGWPITLIGILLLLVAFSPSNVDDPLPMRIASIGTIAGGAFLLFMYRNFYVIPGEHDIDFRGIFGQRHRIVYREIDSFSVSQSQTGPALNIRSIDGTKLSLDPTIYDLSQLTSYVQEHGTRTQPPQPLEDVRRRRG